MPDPIANFLSTLSRVTLDPALGGRGLALSRVLSLSAFAIGSGDKAALGVIQDVTDKMAGIINTGRDMTQEEYNDLQATSEASHWGLRQPYPQRGRDGAIAGGYQAPQSAPAPTESPTSADTAPSSPAPSQGQTSDPSSKSPSSPGSQGASPTGRQAPVA
jgi:hypothetical protein